MTTFVFVTICFLLLASPILWVACLNVVGLKRLSQRLDYLEDDSDALRYKTRSLQSQVTKKNRAGDQFPEDSEINREIEQHIRLAPGPETPAKVISRGGIRDAGSG